MNNFEFKNPTKLFFGKDQVLNVGKETRKYGKNVLMVTGGGSVKKSGLYDRVMGLLKEEGHTVYGLEGIEPNPRITTVRKGIEICKKEKVDIVLAVGGGSVLDASKAICAGAKYDGDVWDFYSRKTTIEDALPLGTVLTLAATGSEMNGNSVVTNLEIQEKIGVGSPYIYPRFSVLDPSYTYSVPEDQTVNGIVDIMAHVFEQYFSHTPNTPIQDQWSESILRTVIEQAPIVIKNPNDYDARANILLAGTVALNGLIGMGKDTDWATHGIEHEVSAIYDIPHGGGLAIIFPNWMKYVYEENVAKFKQYATRVWDVQISGKSDQDIALEGIAKTREFFNSIDAPSTLKDYNIHGEHIEIMAKKATRGQTIGEFKRLTETDVKNILTMCL
ncbi:iron-containing alcohol dehydrogenase [Tepidibacillus marianensis]|uniref:iron-containing alcohol dehydrogenase n=1 Tax=Tepidibacillus marianensis TaxID=3131995 RepID=UPI0030D3D225